MIEQQLERIATALEKLVAAEAEHRCDCAPPPPKATAESGPSFAEMDRDQLLKECEARGIDVPTGTRTTTLVKNLEAWTPPAEAEPAAEPEPDFTPAEVVEDDPFGAESDSEPKPLTRDDVRAKLTELMEAKDKSEPGGGAKAVTEILETFGGVKKFKDLPDDKLEAVMNAAETECP